MNDMIHDPEPDRGDTASTAALLRAAIALLEQRFDETGDHCLALMIARNYGRLARDPTVDPRRRTDYGRSADRWRRHYDAIRFASRKTAASTGSAPVGAHRIVHHQHPILKERP